MRYRPLNAEPRDPRLARYIPDDFRHLERWALTVDLIPPRPVPVTIGVNWYSNFDSPEQDSRGRWWVGRGPLGHIRGGHCVCLEPGDPMTGTFQDSVRWWEFYDQGREGACVGFGSSRMMSLLNRRRYNARWLWDRAKERDEWPETNPGDNEGTSVRAAMDALRALGHAPNGSDTPRLPEGISANRWAPDAEAVSRALQSPANERLGAVRFLNSWGRLGYPHRVWMPLEVLQRLLEEYGEATIVTDR